MPLKDPLARAAYQKAYFQSPTGRAAHRRADRKQWAKNSQDPDLRAKKNEYSRARYAKLGPEARRADHLAKKYGMSPADFERMAQKQCNRCAICDLKKKLHVDHCHQTGRVRALLCSKCNMGIGMFEENSDKLKAAVNYVERHCGNG